MRAAIGAFRMLAGDQPEHERAVGLVVDTVVHRAELGNDERLLIASEAPLAKQDRAARIEPDRKGDQCEQRREDDQQNRRAHDVEHPAG